MDAPSSLLAGRTSAPDVDVDALAQTLLERAARAWTVTDADDHADLRPSYCRDPTPSGAEALVRLRDLLELVPAMAPFYAGLDATSQDVMANVLLFRALGRDRIPASASSARYRAALADADRVRTASEVSRTDFWDWTLDRFDLRPLGSDLDVESHAVCIATFFGMGQYTLDRPGAHVMVEPGDVVIDGGACWGDTTLHFADQAGPGGRVVALEFDETNLEVCARNLERNARLADRISFVERALWDVSGEEMAYEPAGYGTRIVRTWGDSATTRTITIDDLVAQEGLERVDYIKLDIEGAEINALRGAEQTLREHKPKLAIAAYHLADDLAVLPQWVDGLGLGYRFWVDHYTTHQGETVVYAA